MGREYAVALADVVDSQSIADREAFETRLQKAMARVNDDHRELLQAPFSTIKGIDEFGGVLTSVAPVADIQKAFSRALHPERFRMAVVVGLVDVNETGTQVARMDGPAFARGDAILADLERSGFRFELRGETPYVDELLSDQINLLEIIREGWGETTAAVVSEYGRDANQEAVAETLDVSPQTVSYHLGKPSVGLVLQIEERLSNVFDNYEAIGG